MGKYLSIIGLFVVGVIIVIFGVYYLLTSAVESFEYQLGIILMLIGLLVTGVGAIRGKRTMRSVGYFAQYPPGAPPRPVRPAAAQARPAPGAPVQPPAPRPTPSAPATQPAKASPAKAAEKVVKVLVCPKCGSENQVTDMFCFSCGKKLRPKSAKK
ncbi:MAG: zinc-ribbon domain-containing protein [Candidatus Aenigmatarchaeota archaeon]|nr:MAG: zinc-ribbon domain-containing protein [Candidatus Aenigmarchaeota archaeon]